LSAAAGLLLPNQAVAAGDVVPMVSVRNQHTLALSADGRVLAWGSDQNGQLGSGARTFETRPGAVVGLANVSSIASGGYFSLAVRSDGTVWTWGANNAGQLGDGTTIDRSVPTQVAGLDNVVEVCGGASYALARKRDGTVWGWGSNYDQVLADDQLPESSSPVVVKGLGGIRQLACGDRHALALQADGTVLAWGRNDNAALGVGDTVDRSVPTPVRSLTNVRSIAAAQEFSVALRTDGTVWEWGMPNPFETPRQPLRTSPVPVSGITKAGQIAAGSYYGVAIGEDGKAWWQWTAGTAALAQAPAGDLASAARAYGQGFLLTRGGTVLGFGAYSGNGFGNLGDGTVDYRESPAPVVDIAGIVQVASGTWYGMALGADGRVWSWGLDASGQLGQGRVLLRSTPAVVAGLPKVKRVSAGLDHSLALDADGNLWVWGGNGYAQLGNGTWADTGSPERLTTIDNVRSMLAGSYFSLALKNDGSVWGWGSNLPPLPPADASQPIRLHDSAIALAAGGAHILTLGADGTVSSWGDNSSGQLGDGTLERRAEPRPVAGLTGVVAIAASENSSYAVRSDGTVWAWGENERGQLGDGTRLRHLRPQAVAGLSNVVALAVGHEHALAQRRDGSILGWWWGYNLSGELGTNQEGISDIPRVLQVGPGRTVGLAAGASVSAFVAEDGTVLMGGSNASGQIGDGSFATAMRPVNVIAAGAAGLLDLNNIDGARTPIDPSYFLMQARRGADGLSTILTDLRASGISGDIYFTALVPPSSTLLPAAALRSSRALANDPPGMATIIISRGGVKQTGPTTVAVPSMSGALSTGNQFQVYGASLKDPLSASNAIICMGITIPELSAKGQVLIRPIATGDQVAGVAQCPTVQTAATLRLYSGQASGPINARTITATIDPLEEDRGKVRSVYSWAVAPDGRQFMQTPNGWTAMTEPMQAARTFTVPMSGSVTVPVTTALDLSTFAGTLVYIGLGASWEEVRSLNKAGHYNTVR
jgi:alpha-tubulin suppressor-like RCC1 family protein